jgi:hypothetical protein
METDNMQNENQATGLQTQPAETQVEQAHDVAPDEVAESAEAGVEGAEQHPVIGDTQAEPDYRKLYEETAKQIQEIKQRQYEEQLRQLGQPTQFKPPSWIDDMPEPLKRFAENEPDIAKAMETYIPAYVDRLIEHRAAEAARISRMQQHQEQMLQTAKAGVEKEFGIDKAFWSTPELSSWVEQNQERYSQIQKQYPMDYWVRTVTREFLEAKNKAKVQKAGDKSQKLATSQQEAQTTQPNGRSAGQTTNASWKDSYEKMKKEAGIRHI